jgi:hypothetical protein
LSFRRPPGGVALQQRHRLREPVTPLPWGLSRRRHGAIP